MVNGRDHRGSVHRQQMPAPRCRWQGIQIRYRAQQCNRFRLTTARHITGWVAMNLDELSQAIHAAPADPVADKLADLLLDWKIDDSDAEELRERVERYLGNTWVENDMEYGRIYDMWSAFRSQAIDGIKGLTMNERLYWFGLFQRFDAAQDQDAKRIVYHKLLAAP